MSDVVNLLPRIAARRRAMCSHDSSVIDYDVAELECADCGAPLDPWWVLRKMARDDSDRVDRWIGQVMAESERIVAEANERIANLNETIRRLNAEVQSLSDAADRLRNETIGGVRVGNVARRRRSKP